MIVFGAGGHAKVVLEMLKLAEVDVETVYDDNPELQSILGYPVMSTIEMKYDGQSEWVIAIGSNTARARVVARLNGPKFGAVLDPGSRISNSASIGAGTVVMPGVTVNAASIVGEHCIVNTGSVVEHDCQIGDFVHIGPNATLCGEIIVGEGSLIGAGAVVLPGVKIGSWVTVGAGSVVIGDLPDGSKAVGNPARVTQSK